MKSKPEQKNELLAAKCEVCGDFPILICKPKWFVQCSCGAMTQYRDVKSDAIVDWLMCRTYKRKALRYNAIMSLLGYTSW